MYEKPVPYSSNLGFLKFQECGAASSIQASGMCHSKQEFFLTFLLYED